MENTPKKATWAYVLLWILSLVFCSAVSWLLLFHFNTFTLNVKLNGSKTESIYYGESYTDPGCKVILKGDVLLPNGITLNIPVHIDGEVDIERVGKNVLHYSTQLGIFHADAERTVRVIDAECPVIELVPDPEDIQPEPVYQEAGFSAYDNYDGDLTDKVVRTELEDRIMYSVLDSSGNPCYVERMIPEYDSTPPIIFLEGGETLRLPVGTKYREPGFSAYDNKDGDITAKVVSRLEQDVFVWYLPGTYSIRYEVSDQNGNVTAETRKIILEAKEHPVEVEPEGKTIYLTFDDGPCPDTVHLLDVLKKYNVKATFFVVDTGYPEIMKRIVEEGHSIGVHTRTHRYNEIYASPEAFFEDLLGMQQVIYDATGVRTYLMRFPGGSSNLISSSSKGIMTLLANAVQDAGFSYFDWNVDSDDAGKAMSKNAVLNNIRNGASNQKISVVLQHDIHPYSVDAVEEVIAWGISNGYTFLPLSQDSPAMHHMVLN